MFYSRKTWTWLNNYRAKLKLLVKLNLRLRNTQLPKLLMFEEKLELDSIIIKPSSNYWTIWIWAQLYSAQTTYKPYQAFIFNIFILLNYIIALNIYPLLTLSLIFEFELEYKNLYLGPSSSIKIDVHQSSSRVSSTEFRVKLELGSAQLNYTPNHSHWLMLPIFNKKHF